MSLALGLRCGSASPACSSNSGLMCGSDRSWPAQNARPAPVMSTALTASSCAASSKAMRNWPSRPVVNAFSACGRFSVRTRTAPSVLISSGLSSAVDGGVGVVLIRLVSSA